ncbi:hypothetical protein EOPP23_07660 [Endozoicomonas sp. OPT23]|uniref:hypothetical protein n=1 Tax=Endozoicomonas sp. OPT23 TaxID=2072845 RepID=UPI00129ABF36|nr:hypothetical protein [Endozoicomonas sp. OPT23]MRI32860.1 hypothetical protein [Endozoicomonas sp. OPT23]
MTATAAKVSASDFIQQRVVDVKSWYDSGSQAIDGLNVRKMPARIKPQEFIKAEGKKKNSARFSLIVSKNYKLWSIDMEMMFYCQPWLSNEGVASGPGLMFSVIDEEGESHQIEFLPMTDMEEQETLNAPLWCSYWIQRLLKRQSIKIVFAYRQLVASEMDD